MTVFETVQRDYVESMKNKDSIKKNLLNIIISDSKKIAKEKMREVEDADVLSSIKKVKRNCEEFNGLSPNETSLNEILILDSYLPKQISEETLTGIIIEFITDRPYNKNMGAIMKYLSANHGGLYDSKKASEIAKKLLVQ